MDINATMISNIFLKKSSGANSSGGAKMQNQQSTEELHKPVTKKVEKLKL